MYFIAIEQENPKKVLVFKIIAFEVGSTNSLFLGERTCPWQSICYQVTPKFEILLIEVYSKTGSIRVMKNIMNVRS